MRVLFVAPPFAGHIDRLVPLMQAAQGAGHAVRAQDEVYELFSDG